MRIRYCIPFLIVAADQLLKYPIRRVPVGHVLMNVPGLFEITHYVNTGAAFSFLSGRTDFLLLISILLLTAITFCIKRWMNLSSAGEITFLCLLGGGIGNMIDRILFGGVTDYIRFLLFDFPVFNFADIAITMSIGVILMLMAAGKLET